MIRHAKVYPLLALMLSISLSSPAGWAFELRTHEEITRAAFDRSAVFDALRDLGVDPTRKLSGGFLQGSGAMVDWLVEGVRDEDDTFSTNFARYRNHFYDPINDRGLTADVVRGEAAPDWALEDRHQFVTQAYSYRDARQAFLAALTAAAAGDREAALARTFETLGHVIHPLQDMASPPHTRNDIHGGFIFGPKSLYEIHLEQPRVLARLDFNGIPVRFGLPRQYWTTGDGRGLAEFVNRNFVSEGTNFTTRAEGSPGGGYPGPVLRLGVDEQGRPFETVLDIQTQLEPGLQDRNGNPIAGGVTFFANNFRDPVTGEALRNERMTALSLFDRELERKGASLLFTLNRYNVEAQAAFLIPRAVGYSAALLDYFFRGRLDVDLVEDLDDPSLLRLTGTNASADTLVDGDLALYAEDRKGERSGLQALEPTAVRGVAAGQEMTSAPFRPSEDAERFVAVYKGTLGLEARDGTFPGGVIGKVLGGVRVEQVFSDGIRWKIRTSRGVFLLPLMVAEFEEVRWGDAENALVARTRFGPGRPNRVAAYEVHREPGSVELATVDAPDGPEVSVTKKKEAVFPFGMSLGTTVHFSQTVEYRQQRLTFEHTGIFQWYNFDPAQPNFGTYDLLGHDEYGSVRVETAVNEVVPFAESFPIALDLERNAHFGTARKPYVWLLTETAVNASWRLLGVVVVYLGSPQTPGVTRSVLGPPDSPLADLGADLVAPRFPFQVDPLLWAIVDLEDGRVVASTAEPTIAITSRRTQETPAWMAPGTTGTVVWQHYFERREGGPNPGFQDRGWLGSPIAPRPEGSQVRDLTELHVRQDGVLELSVSGWLREELKDALDRQGLYGFQLASGQGSRELIYDGAGLRVIASSSWVARSPVQFVEARRARPAPGGERLVLLASGGDEGPGAVLAWDPGTSSATVLHEFRAEFQWLGAATGAAALVGLSGLAGPVEQSSLVVPLQEAQPPIVFPGEDLTWSFTLLDPTHLYNVEDLRFYRLRPPLQRTALPAKLAGVPGQPVGDYHAIRLPAALTP